MRAATPKLQHLPGAVMGLAHEISPGAKVVPETQHAPVNGAGQRLRPYGGVLAVFAREPHLAALRSSTAARSCSSASRSMSRFSNLRTEMRAHSKSLFVMPRSFAPASRSTALK